MIRVNNSTYTSFNYDGLGRLIAISRSLCQTLYTYDARGYLIKEKDYSRTINYTYDDNGNILTVVNQGAVISSFTYDNLYKDRLNSFYNSEGYFTVEYNENNPYEMTGIKITNTSNYKYQFTWEGRRLSSLTYNGINYAYNYDDQGRRIRKISPTETVLYTYEEDKLVSEKHGDDYYIRYHYGLDGRVMFFELIDNNVKQKYYYLWNQIEIIGIVNQNGEVVVTYSYDAYGNVTIGGIEASTIGVKNPFLYRGYYYDHETKLYYCLSRYYNSSWRRWISLDDVSYLEPSKITGLNLFAYCNNDPINKWDPSGHIIAAILFNLFAGAVFGLLSAAMSGRDLLTGMLFGIATGLISGLVSGLPTLVSSIIVGISAQASEFASQCLNNEEIDIGKVLFSGFINAVSYGVGDYMKFYFLGENDYSLLFDIIYLPVFELGKYSLEVSYDKIEEKISKKPNNKKRLENKMLFISNF